MQPSARLILGHFHHFKRKKIICMFELSVSIHAFPSSPWKPFLSLQTCLFWTFHTNGIKCGLLGLASSTERNVFRVHPCCDTGLNNAPPCGNTRSVHAFIRGRVSGLFSPCVTTCSATMNIWTQVSVWTNVFISLGLHTGYS